MASYMGKDKEAEVSCVCVSSHALSFVDGFKVKVSLPEPLWQVKSAVDGTGPPPACALIVWCCHGSSGACEAATCRLFSSTLDGLSFFGLCVPWSSKEAWLCWAPSIAPASDS